MTNIDFLFLMAPPQKGAEAGSQIPFFIMMGLMMVVMYFFMIRPQSKKAKEQATFAGGLKKGDNVVTIAGMHGRVFSLDEQTVIVEIDNNVKVKMDKSAISMEYTAKAYPKGK